MILRLIRHSETEYNKDRRFQGCTDIPLSEHGKSILRAEKNIPEKIYVSGLKRTMQTAEIIFPGAEIIQIPELNEICLGILEGKTHEELKDDPEYVSWLERGGSGRVPGGEDKDDFADRICRGIEKVLAEERSSETVTAVVHGGTIMAALGRYDCRGKNEYMEYGIANGDGYEIEVTGEGTDMKWRILKRISCRKDSGLTHLYYGPGRGKTSIAMGTALRAIQDGYRVLIFQMCKAEGSLETAFLGRHGAEVYYGFKEPVFPKKMSPEQKKEAFAQQTEILRSIVTTLKTCEGDGKKKLLILDEACAAVRHEIIDEDILWDAVLRKPYDAEIILTGRNPAEWMMEAADYCTELVSVAHPLEGGISARTGIDK